MQLRTFFLFSLLVIASVSPAQSLNGEAQLRPEYSGWKVCGYSYSHSNSAMRAGAYSSAEAWRASLGGLPDDPDYGCAYLDSIDFKRNKWPGLGLGTNFENMRTEVARGTLYGSADVSAVTRYGSSRTFGTTKSNLGFHFTFTFSVASELTVNFRYGGDFGRGASLAVDGEVKATTIHDHWWGGNFNNAIKTGQVVLAPGDHTFEVIGFEGCCDGAHGSQFKVEGGTWTDLTSSNWAAAVTQGSTPPSMNFKAYRSTFSVWPWKHAVHSTGQFRANANGSYTWKVCTDSGYLLIIDGDVEGSWDKGSWGCVEHTKALETGIHTIELVYRGSMQKNNRLHLLGGPDSSLSEPHYITNSPVRGLCYQGQKYFTLGEAGPMSTSTACQAGALALPELAQLAPNDDVSRGLIAGSAFGAECMVLADGMAVKTAAGTDADVETVDVTVPVSDDSIETYTAENKKKTQKSFEQKELAAVGWDVSVGRSCSPQGSGVQCQYSITVSVEDWEKDLSHWVLGVPADLAACGIAIVSSGGLGSPALDPTTGLVGMKWDSQINKGTSQDFTITTSESNAPAQASKFAVKGGTYFALGDVSSGFSCSSSTTATTATVSGEVLSSTGSAECGSSKLVTDATGAHSADCSDGVTRRVLAVKSMCDPGDIDIAQREVKNYVVLNGRRYATLDDAPANEGASAGGCGTPISTLPDGWSFAEFNDDTRVLAGFGTNVAKFGTRCIIYADGRGRTNEVGNRGEICAENAIEILEVEGKSLLRVFNHWCPGRILITRAADDGEVDTLNTSPAAADDIKRTSAILGYHYATVDNAETRTAGSGCQARPVHLPDGWEVVPELTEGVSAVLRFNPFQTKCLVFADGSSTGNCGDEMLSTYTMAGKTLYTVRKCDARVLIRHTEIFDPASLAETCGVCTGWGDPHQVSFDRRRFNSYGRKEMIMKVVIPNPTYNPCTTLFNEDASLCDFNIFAWQVPLGHVATNKGVLIQHAKENGQYESIVVIVDHTIKRRSNTPHLEINGVTTELNMDDTPLTTARGAVIRRKLGFRRAPAWEVSLPNDIVVLISQGYFRHPLLHYTITLPKRFRGTHTVHGICGDCNGDQGNDMYDPIAETVVNPVWNGSRKNWNKQIQNNFINKNAVVGPNPFDETVIIEEPEELTDETPEACDNVAQKVLDLVDSCCSTHEGEALALCRDEVCINGGCESMEVITDVETAGDEVVTGPKDTITCGYAAMESIEFAQANMGGRIYATLDGAANDGGSGGSQSVDYAIPEGWRIADHDEINLSMAGCFAFGTDCLILADGTGVTTDGFANSCGKDLILRSGENGRCVRPSGDRMRILLTKNLDANVATMLNGVGGLTSANKWYKQDSSNNVEYPEDEEDPAEKSIVRISAATTGTVTGIFKRWILAEHSGVIFNHFTAPISASVWARALAGTYATPGSLPSEWIYAELDITMSDGTLIRRRSYDFSVPDSLTDISHGWERLVVDFNLPKIIAQVYGGLASAQVTEFTLHLVMKDAAGTVEFGEPVWDISKPSQVNYFSVGDFNDGNLVPKETGDAYASWMSISGNPTITRSSSVAGLGNHPEGKSGSLRLAGEGIQQVSHMYEFGSANGFLYDLTAPANIMVCTWHKSQNVIGTESAGSSLYVDILCTQEGEDAVVGDCSAYGNVIPTQVGDTPWYRTCQSIETRGHLSSRLAVTARLTQGGPASASFFDGVFAMPTCSREGTKKLTALVYGDPHYVTGDGVKFDAQRLGEYEVYNDQVMKVQQRHSQAGGAAVVSAVAVHHHSSGNTIQIDRPAAGSVIPTVRVNGEVMAVDTYSNDNIAVEKKGQLIPPGQPGFGSVIRYTIRMWGDQIKINSDDIDNPDVVTITAVVKVTVQNTIYGASYMAILFTNPSDLPGNEPVGLLGNFNGNPDDDFVRPDASVVAGAPSVKSALEDWVESWRIKESYKSLFVYQKGMNLQSHYKPDFTPVDLDSFTDAEKTAAANTCRGVNPAMTESTMFDCVLDVLAGGDGYAAAAASLSSHGYSNEQEPLFDVLPPSTDDGSVDPDSSSGAAVISTGVLLSLIGGSFFTCVAMGVCMLCAGAVMIRIMKASGYMLVQKKDEKAALLKEKNAAQHLRLAEEGMAPKPAVMRRVSSIVAGAARQLSNFVAEQAGGTEQGYEAVAIDDRALPSDVSEGEYADKVPALPKHGGRAATASMSKYSERPNLKQRAVSK